MIRLLHWWWRRLSGCRKHGIWKVIYQSRSTAWFTEIQESEVPKYVQREMRGMSFPSMSEDGLFHLRVSQGWQYLIEAAGKDGRYKTVSRSRLIL